MECDPKTASVDSIISLKKELTPKMCILCIVIINSILFDLFCVWISSGSTQGTTSDVHNVVQKMKIMSGCLLTEDLERRGHLDCVICL